MKGNNIRKTAIMIAMIQSLSLAGCKSNTTSVSNTSSNNYIYGNIPEINVPDGYVLNGNKLLKDNFELACIDGYHFVTNSKMEKNPDGLVDSSFIPEVGYHLEQYDYDDSLFYVIRDGYHNEKGYLISDGYHLEGNKIIKNYSLKELKLK